MNTRKVSGMLPDKPEDLNPDDVILGPDDEPPRRARMRPGRAKLRVVESQPEQKKPTGWTKISMEQLADRAWDRLLPPKVRLYLYLQNEVRKGNPITLTNAAAAKLGLDRHDKWRELRVLEKMGLVTVVAQEGLSTSVVLWHPGPPTRSVVKMPTQA